jgi:site-specific recombinase XerD
MEGLVMNKNGSTDITLSFAPLLEKYFLTYLIAQKKSSPRTVSTYRDSFTLYLRFLESQYGISPDRIEMVHFSLEYLSAFGRYLESIRNCGTVTINLRISAIKSFLKYAVVEAPEYSGIIRKSLSLPARKTEKQIMCFVTKDEYESMLEVCSNSDILSVRDKMILMILYNTGCRVSELVGLLVSDLTIEADGASSIRFMGKGRKERITPIWKSTAVFVESYIETQGLTPNSNLLQNKRRENLTRSGVGQRISAISKKAAELSPSLNSKNVTPHTFRHSAAMNLLQAGVDISTIAIWLGHESIETTHKYMVADIEIKRKAMEKLDETLNNEFSYKPSKSILSFLSSL